MSRFTSPSSYLSLSDLLRVARRAVLLGLALALGGHLALSRLRAARAEQRTAEPLTTQFVKRAARLTKPPEVRETHSIVRLP